MVEFTSVTAARQAYDACDGLELETTGNVLDVRFIPDDMTFEQEPRDTATSAPVSYQPLAFQTPVLNHLLCVYTHPSDIYRPYIHNQIDR